MSTSHPQEQSAWDRFIREIEGKAERTYPQGRISPDDLGKTAFAVAADLEHKVIRIQFTKPITWLGLDIPTAEKLVSLLSEKLGEIRS